MRVSILCPLYNHAAYIADTIRSIQQQTWTDWELIIVDDASTDQGAAVANTLAQQDSRIRVIQHPTNQGINHTLATAWTFATGDAIALTGSDDRFRPDKLAQQVSTLERHAHIGAVYTHATLIDSQGQPLQEAFFPVHPPMNRSERLRTFLYQNNHLCASSVMMRRSVLTQLQQPFNPLYLQMEDFDRNVKLALITELAVLPDPLVEYRRHAQNVSQASDFTAIRTRWETVHIWLDVCQQMRVADAIACFPEQLVTVTGDPVDTEQLQQADVPYLLAMAAWQHGQHQYHKLFGLLALQRCMVEQPDRLAAVFGFTLRQYHQLTGQVDFFHYDKRKWIDTVKRVSPLLQVPIGARRDVQVRLVTYQHQRPEQPIGHGPPV
jgi:GT2 family glycosyltransferase